MEASVATDRQAGGPMCPVCKQRALLQNRHVIFCGCGGVRLETQHEGFTLDVCPPRPASRRVGSGLGLGLRLGSRLRLGLGLRIRERTTNSSVRVRAKVRVTLALALTRRVLLPAPVTCVGGADCVWVTSV